MLTPYERAVGRNIGSLRREAGYSQEQFAAKCQLHGHPMISREVLAKIEVGIRHMSLDEIVLFKNILKVSLEDIFDA